MSRKSINIIFFSLSVLMLLIRPYLVYHLTGHSIKDKNPVKTSLLQRLIKKKEEHYEYREIAAAETHHKKFSFRIPVNPLSFFQVKNALPVSGFYLVIFTGLTSVILGNRYGNQRYGLLSCLRI
ncbi:hypothetical protein [Mucilaginibacter sp. SG564]|uniref:hypothetical protein n=1 Tax=unclassified Mucilaginibacter TaxID=2617802 RepID=UPI0015555AA2|nr:hypothetical protein [Mucilaginibacter sp. SG564]NOW98075.1 hypothetical protein [Mucilaginibacter sp. SG564]